VQELLDRDTPCNGFLDVCKAALQRLTDGVFHDPAVADLFSRLYTKDWIDGSLTASLVATLQVRALPCVPRLAPLPPYIADARIPLPQLRSAGPRRSVFCSALGSCGWTAGLFRGPGAVAGWQLLQASGGEGAGAVRRCVCGAAAGRTQRPGATSRSGGTDGGG